MPDTLVDRLLAAITEVEQREAVKVQLGLTAPSLLLSLCAASREIVERHSLRGKSVLRNGEFVDHCACCQRPIPCPDLRSLARAYGLNPEENG